MSKRLFLILLFFSSTFHLLSQHYNYHTFRKRLDSVVTFTQQNQSNYCHFARLYQINSSRIRELALNGELNDSTFIHRFEERFGYYYLKSLNAINNNTANAYVWQKAFDTLVHPNAYSTSLILSINAHVNHDLFFALHDVFDSLPPTRKRKKDFKKVAKIHDKIIKDYFENIFPYIDADKKWERQTLRKLSRQAAHILKIERNSIWRRAKKAKRNKRKFKKYSRKQVRRSKKLTNAILSPKGLVKKGFVIANKLDQLSFSERIFLLNNKRP